MNSLYEENGYEHIIHTHNCNNKIICKYGLVILSEFCIFQLCRYRIGLKIKKYHTRLCICMQSIILGVYKSNQISSS